MRGDEAAPVADAAARGRLTIWSSTDRPLVKELLAGFQARHPGIAISYHDLPAMPMHRVVERRARAGGAMPDLLWSSAMDLQIKLVNDGYALRYDSPERPALPGWANWKNEAWGVTAEPIVIVYNRRLLPSGMAPTSHADLLRLLERRPKLLRGRIATYDVANSAVGYLYLSQDAVASRLAWPLVRALGANGVRLFRTSEQIISDVSRGRSVIGYNVVGSYAIAEHRRNPDLAVVLPSDYTLLMSRIAVIPARASHPEAARLFLDYLLSEEGQAHLVRRAMPSVRRDLPVPESLRTPEAPRRAIRVGPALLVVQDQLTRRRFLAEWTRLIGPAPGDGAARR
jgi:iron(III) transport system substrate-binding protein